MLVEWLTPCTPRWFIVCVFVLDVAVNVGWPQAVVGAGLAYVGRVFWAANASGYVDWGWHGVTFDMRVAVLEMS